MLLVALLVFLMVVGTMSMNTWAVFAESGDEENSTLNEEPANASDEAEPKEEASPATSPSAVHPKLPAPTNLSLTYLDFFRKTEPFYATFDWDHSDLEDELKEFLITLKWKKDGGEKTKKTTLSLADKNGVRDEYEVKVRDFLLENGEGTYSFTVQAIATGEKEYVDSDEAESQEVKFYRMQLGFVTLDAEGNPEANPNLGGEVDVRKGGNSIYAYGVEDDKEIYVLRDHYEFSLVPEPWMGYEFVGFSFDENDPDQDDPKEAVDLVMQRSFTATATFKPVTETSTVTVEFGEDHTEYAKNVANAINTYSRATGEKAIYPFYEVPNATAEVDGTKLVITMPNSGQSEYDVIEYLEEAIEFAPVGYEGEERELYWGTVAKNTIDKYTSYEELDAEWEEAEGIKLGETLDLYALWCKLATKADLTIAAPTCGTVVKLIPIEEDEDYDKQDNAPEVTVASDEFEKIELFDGAYELYWLNSPDAQAAFEGTIEGGKSYTALVPLYPKFGYYYDKKMPLEITVNGKKLSVESPHGWLDVYVDITAEHDWGEWEVTKRATVDEEGEETRACKNDPTHIETRPIPKLAPEEEKTDDTKAETPSDKPDTTKEEKKADTGSSKQSANAPTTAVNSNAKAPKTGDDANVAPWMVMMGVAYALICVIAARRSLKMIIKRR